MMGPQTGRQLLRSSCPLPRHTVTWHRPGRHLHLRTHGLSRVRSHEFQDSPTSRPSGVTGHLALIATDALCFQLPAARDGQVTNQLER